MNTIKQALLVLLFVLCVSLMVNAQHHEQTYVPETDPLVLEKLDQWQDLKFGLLMHWGAYSQWGIVESWSICPEDYGWCERKKGAQPDDYTDYVTEYEGLKTTFNPTRFAPDKWAKAAAGAGMKYVVFTTKHHDGFCMFDSKYTDYKVTDTGCPFSNHPKSNIAKEIFDSFRAEGLWAGAYFSKPDWHSNDYWWPYFPPKDRNVNYDPEAYPERWENFVKFTQNQLMELMTDYGKIDILWLDGGWVANYSDEAILDYYRDRLKDPKTGFQKSSLVRQDIRMDELVKKARIKQPGLIVVDRAVEGKNQNYLTPENRVPDKELPYPWESCIIAGGGWSWVPDAEYMSGRTAIHMLVDIVAKGGNLLFNIAPGPDGTWHPKAYQLLEEMGHWIKVNGDAIYGTRAIAPYKEGNIGFTQNKDGSVNAIYMAKDHETLPPARITLTDIQAAKGAKVTFLGTDVQLNWHSLDRGFEVTIPEKIRSKLPCKEAWTIRISEIVVHD